jgi:glycine/D-amino acid oxidase-like deaminating enzyme
MVRAMAAPRVEPPSFWLAELADSLVPRPPLEGEHDADVAIVGAGYTGLWTAYYLAAGDPSLRIAMVEREIAGFGAAGRNGGWCTPHLAGIESWMRGPKREGAIALQRAMFDAVDEVGRVAAAESIACDFAKGGFVTVAANEREAERVRALLAEARERGFGEADFRWLEKRECDERVRIAGARGCFHSPHGAAVQPAKLARGLAAAIERHGVVLYEASPARSIAAGEVVTERGRLRARVVLLCTEGYSGPLDPQRRLLPLHSMMLATAPLSDAQWQEIGCADRILFGDARRIVSYAQRTADGRIALGAGGLYLYGSVARRYFPPAGRDFDAAESTLAAFFPQLRDVEITHRWGGALGVPRDSKPFVRFDARTGLGAAGGYVGNGVAAANLAGRTLADLVSGRDTDRTRHPWVQHRSPSWEPEPLRWIGATAVLSMGAAADRRESRGRAAGLPGRLFDAMSGH